ncbi:hypothetical protein [Microbacterium sp. No. 7]|nr:hypothetical protein [Microbacterium sp. No. 7]
MPRHPTNHRSIAYRIGYYIVAPLITALAAAATLWLTITIATTITR